MYPTCSFTAIDPNYIIRNNQVKNCDIITIGNTKYLTKNSLVRIIERKENDILIERIFKY